MATRTLTKSDSPTTTPKTPLKPAQIRRVEDAYGITSIEQWADLAPIDILAVGGVGRRGLEMAREMLSRHGLRLLHDRPSSDADANQGRECIPFTVVIDTREQAPFAFHNITDGVTGKDAYVPTVRRGLKSGDYSILGFEDRIAIERKSHEDLYQTLSIDRERFERELERLSTEGYEFAAVVTESSWSRIVHAPPERTQVTPIQICRAIWSYQQRFPRVHWIVCPDRRFAEIATFRHLELFWRRKRGELAEGLKK